MKLLYGVLLGLHLFVGLGAMGGGMMAILNPEGPGGLPSDALRHSPFSNFLIPGIILFTVIGLGNVFSAITLMLKSRVQGYISSIFGWALVIWIVVQCIMLNTVVSLHVIFFIIGLIEAVLAAIILFKDELFPTNIIINVYREIKKTGSN